MCQSPAIIIEGDNVLAALMPNLTALNADFLIKQPVNMDLNNDGENYPKFSFNIAASNLTFHSIYSRNYSSFIVWSPNSPLTMDYVLFLAPTNTGNIPQGYRYIHTFLGLIRKSYYFLFMESKWTFTVTRSSRTTTKFSKQVFKFV